MSSFAMKLTPEITLVARQADVVNLSISRPRVSHRFGDA